MSLFSFHERDLDNTATNAISFEVLEGALPGENKGQGNLRVSWTKVVVRLKLDNDIDSFRGEMSQFTLTV